jgi:hypothetical protein
MFDGGIYTYRYAQDSQQVSKQKLIIYSDDLIRITEITSDMEDATGNRTFVFKGPMELKGETFVASAFTEVR